MAEINLLSKQKITIYLADLTHTSIMVASNVMPLGIGLLASYLLKNSGEDVEIELFKYPSNLDQALSRQMPHLIGFANYAWNSDLAYKFAARIKEVSPETVVVFGGPNYGLTSSEFTAFWKRHPLIDFYIVGEGEIAFLELYRKLKKADFNVDIVKNSVEPLFNCHYLKEGEIIKGDVLPRIEDLDSIGSPYLLGLMDKFFDDVLIPMIHTTRGCPFTCVYCSEGSKYYSHVSKRYGILAELGYIAERKKNIEELLITDANFGMYEDDIHKAESIAEMQKKYDWPKRIFVSTGKNHKDRVVNVAHIVNGAISIAASLQSTDKTVLENIKRSNISLEALETIVRKSNKVGSSTYSEIILGLPGDTIGKHTESLRQVVNSGLGLIRMYQLILLPQTELNSQDSRDKYGIKTKFRISPRSYGRYNILDKPVAAVEAEEICVATNTLSFEDYLECRELDLSVEIIHNSGMFSELHGLVKWLKISWFDFILSCHRKRRSYSKEVIRLYDNFNNDNRVGLWNSIEDLEDYVSQNLDKLLLDTEGTNEISKSKAKALSSLLNELHDILYTEMQLLLAENGFTDGVYDTYIRDLKEFSILRRKDFINTSANFETRLHFDFKAIQDQGFSADPKRYYRDGGIEYSFFHNDEQKKMIDLYITQYGTTVDGLGRVLMRAPAKWLFRSFGPTVRT